MVMIYICSNVNRALVAINTQELPSVSVFSKSKNYSTPFVASNSLMHQLHTEFTEIPGGGGGVKCKQQIQPTVAGSLSWQCSQFLGACDSYEKELATD